MDKPRGRPRLGKRKSVHVRVSDELHKRWEEVARRRDLSVAALLKAAANELADSDARRGNESAQAAA
jgi:hypothetical protein